MLAEIVGTRNGLETALNLPRALQDDAKRAQQLIDEIESKGAEIDDA